ncbi:MAG TPA: thioesterase family protein [Stenomitos sp.]
MNGLSEAGSWFDYPMLAQPHHTDYSGVVWHGAYLTWMEEARIEALNKAGIGFAELVAIGCDLPVVDLSLSYRKSVRMGESIRVRTRLDRIEKVRFLWTQNICALDSDSCYVAAQVVLVPVDRDSRRILRKFPPLLEEAIAVLRPQTVL